MLCELPRKTLLVHGVYPMNLIILTFLNPAFRPGDNSNQCAQGYGCPPPTIVLDNFSPINNRYIDVGAGGPIPFTFTTKTTSSWLKLSPASGSVSPSSPETRVFASVADWSQLKEGTNAATITFIAKAKGQPDLSVNVIFNAVKNTPAGGFKGGTGISAFYPGLALIHGQSGFIEGTGVVSIEAAHASRKSTVDGITWTELPRLGRTLSAVTPLPLSDKNFTVGAGPTL